MTVNLLPIAVQGGGTADIESLPSYIHRAAYHHGIYVGELIRFSDRQVRTDPTYRGRLEKIPSYIQNHEILRNNKLSHYLVDMFEHLTRQTLSGTYASVINSAFTRSSSEILKGFRWCPECLDEMAALGEVPYFKLIWQFQAVKSCPIHRSQLMQECDFCGCRQTGYKKTRNLDLCQQCGKSLAIRKRKTNVSNIAPSWEEHGQDILELIKDIQQYGEGSLPENGIVQSVSQLFDYYWRQNKEDIFYELLCRDKLLSVIHYGRSLCLNDSRKLSFRLGISLYDLISGNAINATPLLGIDNYCPFPNSFRNPIQREVRNHKFILQELKKLSSSKNEHVPLSLKATARKLGVSIGYLEYRFPTQVKEITSRYKQFRQAEKLKKIYLAKKRSLEYFLSESERTAPKSRKQAYRLLKEETGLPKWVLKKAIQAVFMALK